MAIILVFFFGLFFIFSLNFNPEWLGLENWKTSLSKAILANSSVIFTEIFLGFVFTELTNITDIRKRFQYWFGNKFNYIENRILFFTRTQIEEVIKSGKYIPSVFIETIDIKEKLRYFCDPYIFIQKILDKVKYDLEETDTYSRLKKVYFPLDEISFPALRRKKKLNKYIEESRVQLQKIDHILEMFNEQGAGLLPNYLELIPADKRYHHEYHKAFLYKTNLLERIKTEAQEDLNLLTGTMVLISSTAGRGKTNLLCDFSENYLLQKNKLCLFFLGRDFNYMGGNESLEDAISRIIFSNSEYSFADLLFLIKIKKKWDYLFIVIDGINEHENLPQFELTLEQFIQRNFDKPVKIILSCRTEYLNERFGKLLQLVRTTNLPINIQFRTIPTTHLQYLLEKYFEHFNIALEIDAVAELIQKQFYEDKLLLRFFCEAYENRTEIKTLDNIYRFEIFKIYYIRKCQEIAGLEDALAEITNFMIENNDFIDISTESFSEKTQEVLIGLFDQSLLFRKDLIADSKLAFARKEVINFVYDEFREFLLASSILRSWQDNQDATISQMDKLLKKPNVIAEGLERYLGSWAIDVNDEKLLKQLRAYKLFNDIFIENIFAVSDSKISINHIRILSEIFFFSSEFSRRIIKNLISRCNPEIYPRLNIDFIVDQISKMNIEQYTDLIQSALLDNYQYMEFIYETFMDAFQDKRVYDKSKPKILRFLICLIGIKDEYWYNREINLGTSPVITMIIRLAPYYSSHEIKIVAESTLSKMNIRDFREELISLVKELVNENENATS